MEQKKQQRWVLFGYIFMFLTILCIVPSVFAYLFAHKVNTAPDTDVWLTTHALWIIRHLMIFFMVAIFSVLWLIPLAFMAWNANLIVTGTTIIGAIGLIIAVLILLNAWLKGIAHYFRAKPVY